jgi:hypothetical protein
MSSYENQWKRYRDRRTKIVLLMVAEFLAFIPVVALVAVVERRLFSTSHLALPTAVIGGLLYVCTGFRLGKFPCPRCGGNFFGKLGGPQDLFDGKGAYCGLKKYADA